MTTHTPDKNDKEPKNVPGKFYVNCNCLDHALCHDIAPNNFIRDDERGMYYVRKQPETPEELAQCREAVECCPMAAIGDDGDQTI
jgi:ferredoxin